MMDYGRKFITTLAEDEWCLRPTSTDQKARKYRFLAGKDKVKTQVWQWTIFLSISVALNVN